MFKILGSPQSKANSRRMVYNKQQKRVMFIKSEAAIDYLDTFRRQCPNLMYTKDGLLKGHLSVQIDIWYRSSRSDLDESIILDAMQGLIYENDNQIKYKLVIHRGVDKENPRSCIVVSEIPDGEEKKIQDSLGKSRRRNSKAKATEKKP